MARIEVAMFGRDLRQLFDGGGVVGLTEAQLVDCIARRDESAEAAFEAILTRHGPAVLACCRRVLGDAAAAEDAFQATFLVLHRRAGSIRVAESLAPWLLHVARMAALKARQGEVRRLARERRVARPELAAADSPSSDVRLLVHEAVDRLPAKYREPVRLCYFEGRTHDDAAASLGWPVGTVRGRLARAREMLRTRLMRRGVGLAPAPLVAAMAAAGDARAEVPQALREATLAAAFRGGAVKAGVVALAAAVSRELAAAAVKAAAIVLAVVSMISAGAGITAIRGRDRTPDGRQGPPRAASAPAGAPSADRNELEGEWRTSLGVVTFKPQGTAWVATFADSQLPTLKGPLDGKQLTLKYDVGARHASSTITLDDSGRSFSGPYQFGEGQRNFVNIPRWQGWRPDPDARKGPTGRFDGLWLTTQGLMELEQSGQKVRGRYARYGPVKIEGTVTGRQVDFRYTWLRNGGGWFDLSKDGTTLEGAGLDDGSNNWYERKGRKASEFRRHAPLKAGQIVDGSTTNLLAYSARAPEGYKQGGAERWPTIVILHGSNMNGKSYVASIAQAWPDIARGHLILGINGETPSDLGEDPRFNYTYVNFMGRSTYRGFPGTDRESPALVSEALDELSGVYPVGRYFVGGHSQGGYLTYVMLMHYPEKIAGAFPVSCEVMIQCEPDVFDNEALRAAQRSVPLAIVHGRNDPNIDYSGARYAADLFGEYGWPGLRLFTSDTAGHKFMLLPVGEAIKWLEAMASDDPRVLVDFAEKQAKAGRYRDAIAALRKAQGLKQADAVKQRADRLRASINTKARAKAGEFLVKIKANKNSSWVDGFLAFRDEFEFADGARPAMEAFEALRKRHGPAAQRAFQEAIMLFRQGKQADGYAKYQEIIDKYYASPRYRYAKEQLRTRKK